MGIIFIRIDDRIIHGQLLTRWSKEQKCDGIVAVDDEVFKDETLCSVLKSAVPDTIKTFIFNIDTFLEKFTKIQESDRHYFLIAKTPITLQKIMQVVDLKHIKTINVGPMSTRDNSISIGSNASILPEEAVAFNYLEENGFTVEFRLVPDSQKTLWQQVKNKFNNKEI